MLVDIYDPSGQKFEVPQKRIGYLVAQGWTLREPLARPETPVARPRNAPKPAVVADEKED